MREGFQAYKTPTEDNNCLYAGMSLVLYGNFKKTAAMKLGALINGVVQLDTLAYHQVRTKIMNEQTKLQRKTRRATVMSPDKIASRTLI